MYRSREEAEERECPCRRDNCCLLMITAILAGLFLFTLGFIIGALVSAFVLANLSAIVILAVVLFILLVLTLIFLYCRNRRRRRDFD